MQNKKKLSLYVPQPAQRPGDSPDFSSLVIPPPGDVPRPDSAVAAHEISDLAFKLIRVLDDDGKAMGPWNPRLDTETLKRGLRLMMLTRAYDDRMYRAQRQGKTSFYMKCTGEEAVGDRAGDGARPQRHVLPQLPPAGPASDARLSAAST